MKKFLMKIKVNMIIVVLLSLVAGMAGNHFFNNRWLGLIIALPLTTLLLSYYRRFVLKESPLPPLPACETHQQPGEPTSTTAPHAESDGLQA